MGIAKSVIELLITIADKVGANALGALQAVFDRFNA